MSYIVFSRRQEWVEEKVLHVILSSSSQPKGSSVVVIIKGQKILLRKVKTFSRNFLCTITMAFRLIEMCVKSSLTQCSATLIDKVSCSPDDSSSIQWSERKWDYFLPLNSWFIFYLMTTTENCCKTVQLMEKGKFKIEKKNHFILCFQPFYWIFFSVRLNT